ncbi:DUF4357 domain-containing protein, partial [Ferrovum myxofaciens]|uniref:DUF4357 domain-containing protein n=1 Tax=Ferrovum myxofaciens TaxID=416213 RepID=UPI000B180D71
TLGFHTCSPVSQSEEEYAEKLSGKIQRRWLTAYIVVLAGSQAVLNERPSSHKYPWPVNMRRKLKEDGALTVKTDHLIFEQDVEFSSPSAAAAVIHGGHANGLTAWKNKDGKNLKEFESVKQKGALNPPGNS